MVAMALGLFLIGSMTKLFINNKSIVVTQNNLAKIQDNAGFGLSLIENDITSTGTRGCSSGKIDPGSGVKFLNVSGTTNYFNTTTFIQGSKGTGTAFSPTLDSSISNLNPAPNPQMDIITIRAISQPSSLTIDMINSSDKLTVANSSNFTTGGYGIISNCFSSSLFKTSNITGSVITPTSPVNYTYLQNNQVATYNTTTYYVGTDNILYKTTNGGSPLPIAYNVEHFSVLYGINSNTTTTNVTNYLFASEVANFNQVVAVRIGMVLRGDNTNTLGTATASSKYTFNGVTYTPNDGKLRKFYYTTITLRNMLP
jgi:type IV pilus assembly protein PilW